MPLPHPSMANRQGIVAITEELDLDRLLEAYPQGIFPWYNADEPVIWWSPNPRFVLFPDDLKVSKSMRKVMRDNIFDFTYNTKFTEVLQNCQRIARPDQQGTWISDHIIETYTMLHSAGKAASIEVWHQQELVGGFYGVWVGQIFCGESMFAKKSNASKAGLIWFVKNFADQLDLIDCQVYTSHFESMGALMIPREIFLNLLGLQTF